MAHLDAHSEYFCQDLDEFAEIYALVGDVVEDGLLPIALILYVADFHVQLQVFGNLARAYHGVLLFGFGLLVLLEVGRTCMAVDASYLGAGLELGFAHLQGHKASRETHDTDVVPRLCFYGDDVALAEQEVVVVAVIALSRVLKLHFYEVGHRVVARYVGHVVVSVEL